MTSLRSEFTPTSGAKWDYIEFVILSLSFNFVSIKQKNILNNK